MQDLLIVKCNATTGSTLAAGRIWRRGVGVGRNTGVGILKRTAV
jgi:hypothetical protein